MSQIETPESTPEPPAVDPETTAEAEPQPEPWTPERVLEWNRYYDLYVACAVLVLLFVVSAHRVVNSPLWVHLQTGRAMIQKGGVLLTDPFSFALDGARWVHVSWLFDLATYGLYQAGSGISERASIPTLVAVNAAIVVLTGLVLMAIRRPGPGLWWSAVCVVMAMGVMIVSSEGIGPRPLLVGLGGIAGRAYIEPETWGVLLLAVELLLLDRGIDRPSYLGRGTSRALFGLVPLFVLWANLDASFLLGLLIAAAWIIGSALRPRSAEVAGPGVKKLSDDEPTRDAMPLKVGMALALAGGCVAACLVNPSIHMAFWAGVNPVTQRFFSNSPQMRDLLSYLSPESFAYFKRQHDGSTLAASLYPAYYAVVVGLGFASFLLNRRRFALGRFLGYAIAALAWGLLFRYSRHFAAVFAAVLATNGQEWFLDRFGAEGRVGRTWKAWSVGGRALTLIVIIAALLRGMTGFGGTDFDIPFSFGFYPEEFAFEAADAVRDPKIEGNVLNLDLEQGDALVWRAYPDRLDYVDDRTSLFPADVRKERATLRIALRDGKRDAYKPILDARKVSVVMLSPIREPRTYFRLASSDDFVLFHDDGNTALFGRADASPADVTYFKDHRFDPYEIVYKRTVRVPIAERPPTPTTWIDSYFTARTLVPTQPHDFVAGRWLDAGKGPEGNIVPDPAFCIAAIREARIALSKNPDDHNAYVLLARAYGYLSVREADILGRGTDPAAGLPLRVRQRATALNYAIQTAAPPRTLDDKLRLALLNVELSQIYGGNEILDLQRDRLQAARDLIPDSQFPVAERDRLIRLNQTIEDLQTRITEQAAAQQAGPAQRAEMALSVGLAGLAIRELKEADQLGGNTATVKWRLIDLYCQTGQPDQANDLLGNPGDPALGNGPGTSFYRQGLVFFLLGNYETSSSYWERSIVQIRSSMAAQAIEGLRSILLGLPQGVAAFPELPSRLGQQASWQFEFGLCALEGGSPEAAAVSLTKSAELIPNIGVRPLIAYYLEKLGKPLPPATAAKPATAPK